MSEEILIALEDLTNGALNYYQTPRVIMTKRDIIETYIDRLQQENQKYKEVIENINLIIKGIAYGGNEDYYMEKFKKINEQLKEVE